MKREKRREGKTGRDKKVGEHKKESGRRKEKTLPLQVEILGMPPTVLDFIFST